MGTGSVDARAFALGCFVFEVVPSDGQRSFAVSWWRDELLKALGSISSVSRVEVHVDTSQLVDGDWKFIPESEVIGPRLQEFLPNPRNTRVAFDISIPKRMHATLLDGKTLEVEKFRVESRYEYFGPATIVACLDGTGDTNSSEAVRLLWRFLQQEFPKHSKTLAFTLVGPSPFHAEFWLSAGTSGQDDPIVWADLGRHGYANRVLSYDPDYFDSLDSAFRYTTARVLEELSLYYMLRLNKNYDHAVSRFIAFQASQLMEMHSAAGFRAVTRRIFRSGPAARELGFDALSAKVNQKNRRTQLDQAVRDLYQESAILSILRDEVDALCPNEEIPEIDTALDIVKFAEGGRGKELEIALISASTLLGGLAGAVAALVAGG